jgi:hypothetical protein
MHSSRPKEAMMVIDKIKLHILCDLQALNSDHSFVTLFMKKQEKKVRPIRLEIVTNVITHYDH